MVQSVAKNRPRELALIERDVASLVQITPPFPRITYDDAIKVLQKAGNPDELAGDGRPVDLEYIRMRGDRITMRGSLIRSEP